MADAPIYTWRDAVEHLVDHLDVSLTARNLRMAKQAVITAYRNIANQYRWKSLEKEYTFATEASYSTGSVAIDVTGGTYERMVTLTTGTWPTNAAEGRIIVSNVHYIVATRESASIITLDANTCPTADIAAGTTYTWYRSGYPMPSDFRKIMRLWDVSDEREMPVVGTDTQHGMSVHYYDTPSTPWHVAIRTSEDDYNTTNLEFGPPPSTSRYYTCMYEASPRRLLVEKYATGTVSITAGAVAVTGSGTTFPTDCVGSIMRFGTTTVEPTSEIGGLDEASTWQNNLYVAQRKIMTRASGTAVTVESTVSSTLSGVKYTISDPIDLHVAPMFTAFLRAAEAEFARLVNHEKYKERSLEARQTMIEAMEADQRSTYSRGPTTYEPFRRVTITDSA